MLHQQLIVRPVEGFAMAHFRRIQPLVRSRSLRVILKLIHSKQITPPSTPTMAFNNNQNTASTAVPGHQNLTSGMRDASHVNPQWLHQSIGGNISANDQERSLPEVFAPAHTSTPSPYVVHHMPTLLSPLQTGHPHPVSSFAPSDGNTVVNHSPDLDSFVFQGVTAGQHPSTLAQSVNQQYGRSMTVEDVLLTYRLAYWRWTPWQDFDSSTLEKVVKTERDQFWNRVATKVGMQVSYNCNRILTARDRCPSMDVLHGHQMN